MNPAVVVAFCTTMSAAFVAVVGIVYLLRPTLGANDVQAVRDEAAARLEALRAEAARDLEVLRAELVSIAADARVAAKEEARQVVAVLSVLHSETGAQVRDLDRRVDAAVAGLRAEATRDAETLRAETAKGVAALHRVTALHEDLTKLSHAVGSVKKRLHHRI